MRKKTKSLINEALHGSNRPEAVMALKKYQAFQNRQTNRGVPANKDKDPDDYHKMTIMVHGRKESVENAVIFSTDSLYGIAMFHAIADLKRVHGDSLEKNDRVVNLLSERYGMTKKEVLACLKYDKDVKGVY